MAWEQRGSQSYYYRSVRSGGQVVKEYAGGGLMGVLASDFDAEQREEREYKRARLRAERERWADLDKPAYELDDLVDMLTATTLLVVGYHQHDRGDWRRRRG